MSTTVTRYIPTLFSAPMVRALLAGKKTQTRRLVRFEGPMARSCESLKYAGQIDDGNWMFTDVDPAQWREFFPAEYLARDGMKCPYGVPGDVLMVREAVRFGVEWDDSPPRDVEPITFNGEVKGCTVWYEADGTPKAETGWGRLRPGIHMPRWACRLYLEVTRVRVERVQDISAKDIIAEGAVDRPHEAPVIGKCPVSAFDGMCYVDLRTLWAAGWDSINGKGSWASNPWVWCIDFNRIEAPMPELAKGASCGE